MKNSSTGLNGLGFLDIDIRLPYGQVHGISANPQKEKKILALHGWLDNCASFKPLLPFLSDHHVVAIDLPGHGISDHKPTGSFYSFPDTVSDVAHMIGKLQWSRTVLMGHSMGAAIACLVASALPEQIEKLILIDGIGPISEEPAGAPKRMRDSLRQIKRIGRKSFPIYHNMDEAIEVRLSATIMAQKSCRLICERGLRNFQGGLTWSSDPRLRIKNPHAFTESQVESFLEQIECEVLLIHAIPGLGLELVNFESRRSKIKKLEYVTFSGNHHLHMDDPELISASITKFLAE